MSSNVKLKFEKDKKGIYRHPTNVRGYNGLIPMYPCIIPNSKHEGKSISENVYDYQSKFIVAKEFKSYTSSETYYRYLVFHHTMDFYQFLDELPGSEWNFHECFDSGQRKLFFDIDIERDEFSKHNKWLLADVGTLFTEEYANSIRDDLIKNISGFFLTCGHILNLNSDFLIYTSHDKNKYSFHIVVDNYSVENHIQASEITKKVLEEVNQKYLRYIDTGVNKSRQMLRIYLNHKLGTDRVKILNKEWIYFDHSVTLQFNTKGDIRWQLTDFKTEQEKDKYLRNLILDKSLISVFRVEPIKINYKIPVKQTSSRPVYYQGIADIDIERISQVLPLGFELGEVEGNYIRLKRSTGALCPICNRVHGPEQQVYLQCFRAKDDITILTKSKLLIILKPELKSNTQTQSPTTKKKVKANKVYNKQHCEELPALSNFIVLLSSYLGTGKTVSFINFVRKILARRVLILSPRRLYAISIANEYNKEGNGDWLLPFEGQSFECYLNHSDIRHLNRLTLQLESIHKLGNVESFDCVIIDEIEGIRRQFSSHTMDLQIRCAETFEKVVKHAKYVIGGDGFLNDKTCQMLSLIKQVHVIRNDFPAPKRRAIRYNKYSHLTHQLEKDLIAGKRVVFVCASRQKAIEFAKRLAEFGITYQIYTGLSDTAQQDLNDLSNVRAAWSWSQCLIYTSTITVGINYDIPNDYDLLYVYGSSFASIVADIFQGMLRVRHIKENTMHYYIYKKPVNNSLPTTFDDVSKHVTNLKNDIESLTEKYLAATKLTIKRSTITDIETELKIAVKWNEAPDWLKLCRMINVQEANQSRVYYEKIFNDYLERCNYVVEEFEVTNAFKRELLEELEDEDDYDDPSIRDYYYHEIPDINDVSYQDLQLKVRQGTANKVDIQMIDKFKLKKKLKEDTSEEIIAGIYDKYFHPSKRCKRKFYNIWVEKTKTIGDLINQEIPNKYSQSASDRSIQFELIQTMNSIIGIKNSCEPFEFPEAAYDQIADQLNHIIPHIDRYFGFTSDSKNPYEIMSKRIIKMYSLWGSIELERLRKHRRINGVSTYFYVLKSNGNKQVYNNIVDKK